MRVVRDISCRVPLFLKVIIVHGVEAAATLPIIIIIIPIKITRLLAAGVTLVLALIIILVVMMCLKGRCFMRKFLLFFLFQKSAKLVIFIRRQVYGCGVELRV